jgi:hypothetical protein
MPNEGGLLLPYPAGSTSPLGSFNKKNVTLVLPEDVEASELRWFAVWYGIGARVARWYMCIPKFPMSIFFGGHWNRKWRYTLWPFGKCFAIWYRIIWQFCIFCCHLVYIHTFPHFGTLYQEKSGNSDLTNSTIIDELMLQHSFVDLQIADHQNVDSQIADLQNVDFQIADRQNVDFQIASIKM